MQEINKYYIVGAVDYCKEHCPQAIEAVTKTENNINEALLIANTTWYTSLETQLTKAWGKVFKEYAVYKLETHGVENLTLKDTIYLNKLFWFATNEYGKVYVVGNDKAKTLFKKRPRILFSSPELYDILNSGGTELLKTIVMVQNSIPGTLVKSVACGSNEPKDFKVSELNMYLV